MTKALIFAALMLGSSTASAQTIPTRVTATALTAVCSQDKGACMTYVLGALDSATSIWTSSGARSPICLPTAAKNADVADVVARYLKANPNQGNANAATATILALRQAFPCGR